MNLVKRIKTAVIVELEIRRRYSKRPKPVHVRPQLQLADGSYMIITKY
jgi:hypothetical protein